MSAGRPAFDGGRAGGGSERDAVELLLVVGPHAVGTGLEVIGSDRPVVLGPLGARLRRVDARTERETVAALEEPCDAVVLAPGVLEYYSGWTADAVRRLDVPVVVARDRHEGPGALGGRLTVTPLAAASVSGGGAMAFEAAVEAAAWLAWDRRGSAGSLTRTAEGPAAGPS